MAKFKITIERIDENVEYTRREWHQLVDKPDEKHDDIYGYVTYTDFRDVTTTVLEQTVEDLDLKTVIRAVNAL